MALFHSKSIKVSAALKTQATPWLQNTILILETNNRQTKQGNNKNWRFN